MRDLILRLMRTRIELRRKMSNIAKKGALRPKQEAWQQIIRRSFKCIKGDLRRGGLIINKG
jgi:hypothetical protein